MSAGRLLLVWALTWLATVGAYAEDAAQLPERVRILDADGKGLADAALVRLGRRVQGVHVLARTPTALATGDAAGWVSLPPAARDPRADPPFAVLAPGHAPRRLDALETGQVGAGHATLRLHAARKHAGRIRWSNGKAVGSSALVLVPVGLPSAVAIELTTQADGSFASDRLGPGAWRLLLERRAGHGLVLRTFQSDTAGGDVVVPLGGALAGRLVDSQASGSKGALGVRVALVRLPRTPTTLAQRVEVVSDPDGRFLVGPLEAGVYELDLADPDWRFDQRTARVEVPAEVTRQESWFVARRPALTGRLLHGKDLPVVGARVTLLHAEGPAAPPAQPLGEPPPALTDAQGRFTIPRLQPATGVRLLVEAAGLAPLLTEAFEVGEKGTTDGGTWRMSTGWSLDLEVRDAEQRLCPGVKVLAQPAAHPMAAEVPRLAALVRRGVCDGQGAVSLQHLIEDDAWILLEAPGHVAQLTFVPRPASGGSRRERLVLARTPELRGSIVTQEATPAADVAVRVRLAGSEEKRGREVRTDPMGRFTVPDLVPRPHDVEVLLDGRVVLQRDGVMPGEEPLELVLPALRTVSGRVEGLRPAGPAPLALLEAPVVDERGERRWRIVGRETLPTGLVAAAFAFKGIAPGDYAVRVVQGALDSDAAPLRVDDKDADVGTMILLAPGSIAGTVIDSEARPLLGTTLTLLRLRGDLDAPPLPGPPLRAVTDDRGGYLFPEVAPGLWRLEAREPDRGTDLEVLRVEEAETLVVRDFVIDGGGQLEGVVRGPRDQRLDGVRIRAWRLEADAVAEETRTRPDGSYVFLGLAPGTWRVETLDGLMGSVKRHATVEVRAGESARLDFEGASDGSIRGRVTRRGDRVPGTTLRVEWMPEAGLALARVERATTDALGEFLVDGLEPGAYRLLLEDGSAVTGGDVQVAEGERVDVDLELFEGRIVGVVLDRDGRAVPYAQVEARPSAEVVGELSARVRSGPDGRFTLSGLPLGRFDLDVRASGRAHGVFREAQAEAPGVDRPVTVVLDRGAEVDVEVRGPTGKPVSGARLSVTVTDEQERASVEALTGPSGRIRLQGVPPGEVRVSVYARELGRASGKLRVGEGETRQLDLRIEPAGSLFVQVLGDGPDPTPRTRMDVVAKATGEVVARRRPLQPTWWSLLFGTEPRSGQVVLRDLAPGDYELRLNGGPRYQPAKAQVRVRSGEATRAAVKLEAVR
jgi:hypothetical protein